MAVGQIRNRSLYESEFVFIPNAMTEIRTVFLRRAKAFRHTARYSLQLCLSLFTLYRDQYQRVHGTYEHILELIFVDGSKEAVRTSQRMCNIRKATCCLLQYDPFHQKLIAITSREVLRECVLYK